ncbi:MAG TPA: glycosyltransferase family 39 protein [Gemmatimonadaceae bacterium]|nr:glycosyltransferase family 39 protein [Gemmatimonadaceae bacterium]
MSQLVPLVVIAAVVLLLRRVRPSFDIATVTGPLEGAAAPVIIGVITTLVTWWLWGSLSATPYVHDEVALLLQAKIFAQFRWAAPSPPLPEFFEQFHVFVTPTLAPKYPPGHALLMVPGIWLGMPGLMSILLSGLTGAMLFILARRYSNGIVAIVTWFIWLIAPAALRFRPSYFSEVTTGAIWLVAWWTLLQYRETSARKWLVALAALVAWGGITRPVTMIVFALPVGCVVLWTVVRRRAWMDVAAALPLALAICAIVPVWGHSVLGTWGKNPYAYYQAMYFPVENPGLGVDSTPPLRALPADMVKFNAYALPMHEVHTAARLPEQLEARLLELRRGMWGDEYFLYLLAIVGALVMPLAVALALGTCALTVLAYLSIAHQPFWLIYYLEVLPVLAFLSALGLWQFVTVVSELAAKRVGRGRELAVPALVTCVGFVAWMSPNALEQYSMWHRRLAMAPGYHASFQRLVQQIPDKRAVVFVRYAPSADVHLSLTNNEPDPASARVWAVHDLGAENLRLLQAAPDRVPYLYEELPDRRVLKPFPIPDEWRAALGSRRLGASAR